MYSAYITKLKNIRPHPNADRLNLAECFGNTVVIGKDYDEDTLYIYFPTDGQLSEEYATINNLVRKKDDAGNNIGGYLDPDKRNIRAIRLRGEKSDGLVMPLESVAYTGADVSEFQEGIVIHMLNGHEICCKYVPRRPSGRYSGNGNRTRKKKVPVAPLFAEHADTEQLAYNLSAFRPGDQIEITLKMHGTSQRTGYLPVIKHWVGSPIAFDIIERKGLFKIFKPNKKMIEWAEASIEPIYDWGYVSGTRRTVLEDYEGGYYGSNEFREQHSKVFEGKLQKGETVYYEVVGFTSNGTPIMSSCDNKKLNDKEFVKTYGKETVFSYGCRPDTGWKDIQTDNEIPQSDIYVYRMTMTNEDGYVVEYTPDFMRYRCEQMGVKTVPVMWKGTIPIDDEDFESFIPGEENSVPQITFLTPGEWIKDRAEEFYEGPDPIGKTHIREGVVVRIINRPKFAAYKHKNFEFKVLEGLIKETAEAPDMEEADGIEEGEI